SRHHNPDQIERISSRKGDHLAGRGKLASCTQRFNCDRERELLAEETIHKAAATDFAPCFESPECQLHLSPLWEIAFASQQVPKDHAVTLQQHPAGCFDGSFALDAGIRVQDCPAASAVTRTRGPANSLSGAALGIDQ